MKRLMASLVLVFLGASAFAQSPNDVIQSASEELTAALSDHKEALAADRDELYATIDNILLPRFDRRYAAQLVLGRHWRDANAEQRDRFIDAFYGSLLRKYSDGVLEFSQDRIEILPFRGDLSKPRTTVKTIVMLDDGTKVPVNYGMVNRDSNWLMFDVTIEGISYVRNFRTELNSEIQATGLDAVITRLEGEATTSE
ncbi:MAG: ABC transporter substrate-binding protein [Gammaproteobacteria bacterium]|nr:ABC transporter substrate-binding protein [Gammaproteobacteria bacterium]